MSIYIIVAVDNNEVKECVALTDLEVAQNLFVRLRMIYSHVMFASRKIDSLPLNLQNVLEFGECR